MEIGAEIKSDAERGAHRLVAEFWDRLYGASIILCKDEHAAEDLVFRTFAHAILKIDQYDSSKPFLGMAICDSAELFSRRSAQNESRGCG